VSRRWAAALVGALWVAIAPTDAGAPRPPPAAWDLFAADALLAGATGSGPLPGEPAALAPPRPLHPTPEPGTAMLAAAGILTLSMLGRRPSSPAS
jgi:hypothetical protein